MSFYVGNVLIPEGTELSNVTGSGTDTRSRPLGWIDYWSNKTNNTSACLGVCPLKHSTDAINICCAIGGMILNISYSKER